MNKCITGQFAVNDDTADLIKLIEEIQEMRKKRLEELNPHYPKELVKNWRKICKKELTTKNS